MTSDMVNEIAKNSFWFVRANTLIGGWAILTGPIEVHEFDAGIHPDLGIIFVTDDVVSEELAYYIADMHNNERFFHDNPIRH